MPAISQLALSYVAGALSTLSPCVLPLLPIILFGALERHTWGPIALAAGLATSFTGLGIALASIGFNLGIDPGILRLVVASLMLGIGIVLLVPSLQHQLAVIATPVARGGHSLLDRLQPTGMGGQFAVGAMLGAIWSPCSGPTLGAAVGMATQGETLSKAAVIMLAFGVGAATPILMLAYGSRQAVSARRDRLAQLSQVAKPLMGASLVAIGAFVLTGFDKIVEASLTRAMPDWLVTVTTRL